MRKESDRLRGRKSRPVTGGPGGTAFWCRKVNDNAEELVDEVRYGDRMSFAHPSDSPFPNHTHRFTPRKVRHALYLFPKLRNGTVRLNDKQLIVVAIHILNRAVAVELESDWLTQQASHEPQF